MVNYGFILVPLYLYPTTPDAWSPLVDAATANPNVTFTAIINPDTGPGGGSCPDAAYVAPIAQLNALANVDLVGYVHTANRWDCDTICTCSAPLADLEANITTYQNWPGCTAQDIHVDGIFIDEAPSNATCLPYMQSAAGFVRDTLTRGSTVFFNAGAAVDASYFDVADYVNVFENSEAAYDAADVGGLDGNGQYAQKSTLLLYSYTSGAATLQRDVSTVLGFEHDAIAGLYVSDLDVYSEFPTIWDAFVGDVAQVVQSNMAG